MSDIIYHCASNSYHEDYGVCVICLFSLHNKQIPPSYQLNLPSVTPSTNTNPAIAPPKNIFHLNIPQVPSPLDNSRSLLQLI